MGRRAILICILVGLALGIAQLFVVTNRSTPAPPGTQCIVLGSGGCPPISQKVRGLPLRTDADQPHKITLLLNITFIAAIVPLPVIIRKMV